MSSTLDDIAEEIKILEQEIRELDSQRDGKYAQLKFLESQKYFISRCVDDDQLLNKSFIMFDKLIKSRSVKF